jgi:hypothetical protein
MTMPLGSAEEPMVNLYEPEVQRVHVVSSDARPGKTTAAEYGYIHTFVVSNQVGNTSVTPGAQRILNRSLRRSEARIYVASSGNTTSTPSPSTPAVPASTVAQQNTNAYPVSVAISGGTVTAVFVNGVQVGSGDGTYIVPSYGAISITYSVAPTWTWSGIATTGAQASTDGVMLGSRNDINTGVPMVPGGVAVFTPIGGNIVFKSQQELWAAFPAGNSASVYVTVVDFQYASDPMDWKRDEDDYER